MTNQEIKDTVRQMLKDWDAAQEMRVETYPLLASNGRYIRKATVVIAKDGRTVRFIDLVPKRLAIKQARSLLV